MVPFVPTMTASLRSLNAEDHVSTAILLLRNFRVATTVSSAPVEGKSSILAQHIALQNSSALMNEL